MTQTNDQTILAQHRKIWSQKPLLKQLYTEWYQMIIQDRLESKKPTVEIGAGTGNLKEYLPEVISTDVVRCDWLDMVFDAHTMPFKKSSIANLVMIDVLHHLQDPVKFLHEAHRVLCKGGRILMIEPYPSPVSLVVYKLFHSEPFIFSHDYFSTQTGEKDSAWDSNQAIPYLLFYKHFDQYEAEFAPFFKVIKKEKFSLLAYPLSGGFDNKSLLPNQLILKLNALEKSLEFLSPLLAFRCYIVLEKK